MNLKQRIAADMQEAMRARDHVRLGTIRLLRAAIQRQEVDGRCELGDAAIIAVVNKLTKQARDAVVQFERGNRDDLAERERAELVVLQSYLPAPLAESELSALINEALTATGASGLADMGKVMARLKPKLTGRADLGAVSARVKAALG